MKDDNFTDKLLFIVVNKGDAEYYTKQNLYDDIGAGIYDSNKRLSYITYWRIKGMKWRRTLKMQTFLSN